MDGFTSYEGGAISYVVVHDHGTTVVHALNEIIALQRFVARYPNYSVREIRRA